ncbi:hypothetical protein L2E82_23004 [Cichorium intybus]|uniref:Uncharacterized protein n=1 Tax=Cichorium intybus TaxID=13427 RepID=A0ACB9DZN2_CICIN|nr:hypothetical protein L2E82_23004 [Cichorium intybus]
MLRSFISSSSRSASSINSSTTVRIHQRLQTSQKQCEESTNLIPKVEEEIPKLQKSLVDEQKKSWIAQKVYNLIIFETETFGKEVANVRAKLKPWEKELIEHQGKLEVASAENKLLSKKSRKVWGDECEDVVGAKQRKNSATIFVIRNGFKTFRKSKVIEFILDIFISFCLNSTGHSTDEYCTPRVTETLKRYSASTCITRVEGGTTALHTELENIVADFVGKPAAMVSGMGYVTNSAILPVLVRHDNLNFGLEVQ